MTALLIKKLGINMNKIEHNFEQHKTLKPRKTGSGDLFKNTRIEAQPHKASDHGHSLMYPLGMNSIWLIYHPSNRIHMPPSLV